MSVQRYDYRHNGLPEPHGQIMLVKADDGAWMYYTDHLAELEALRADAQRLDGLAALCLSGRKIELAQSLMKAGFEIGLWPYGLPVNAIVRNGDIRNVIDAALAAKESP